MTQSVLAPISIDPAFHTHTKTRQLSASAGTGAIASMLRFAAWVKANRRLGFFLDAMSDREIEQYAGWTGTPGAFVQGMLAANWLDGIQGERAFTSQTLRLLG